MNEQDARRRCPGRASWWIAGVAGAGFVAVALMVADQRLVPLDHAVLRAVAARRDCEAMRLAAALSIVGAGEVSLLLTAVGGTLCLLRRRPPAAAALLLLYFSLPVEVGLKLWLPQPPPGLLYPVPDVCEWYRPALSVATPHSFPSGYAIRVTYFAALSGAWLLGRPLLARRPALRWGAALGLTAAAAALVASRTVLSWHWPSDLVGGALLGTALAALSWSAAHASPPRWRLGAWRPPRPAGPPGAARR
ncbi:MAG: phosphatase PAP2 family protein [Chloroflexi bacterium]|nr:phosphatase PAP2 family protein [Chloroflexota bacterium]